MVKICKCCSNVSEEKLLEIVDASNIEFGCIDHCGEFSDKVFGLIDDELVVADTQEAFLGRLK